MVYLSSKCGVFVMGTVWPLVIFQSLFTFYRVMLIHIDKVGQKDERCVFEWYKSKDAFQIKQSIISTEYPIVPFLVYNRIHIYYYIMNIREGW